MPPACNTKHIAGMRIFNGSREELSEHLDAVYSQSGERPVALFFGNSNLIQTWPGAAAAFSRADVVTANDGIALDLAALLVTGSRFRANLNGTDFTPWFIRHNDQIQSVFLLGGRPGVAQRAAQALAADTATRVAGSANGFDELYDRDLCQRINASQADVLLVALGNPMQERWILEHLDQLNVKFVMGVGALFDFLAGEFLRAPRWIQAIKMEWAFRLSQEPTRLARRYSIDMIRFFRLCLADKRRQAEPSD